VPVETPVTMPVAETVAIAVFPEAQILPDIVSLKLTVPPVHTEAGGMVTDVGAPLIVTTAVAVPPLVV